MCSVLVPASGSIAVVVAAVVVVGSAGIGVDIRWCVVYSAGVGWFDDVRHAETRSIAEKEDDGGMSSTDGPVRESVFEPVEETETDAGILLTQFGCPKMCADRWG